MILAMSRPWKDPKTGMYYFRRRTPTDLLPVMRGKPLAVDMAGERLTITPSELTKLSLRTKDVACAKQRHAEVQAQVEGYWANLRKGTIGADRRQIASWAAEWYRDFVREHEGGPGDPEPWDEFASILSEAHEYLDPDGDGVSSPEFDPRHAERILAPHVRLDAWLEGRGIHLAPETRLKLLFEVAEKLAAAARRLRANADGDYSPDAYAAKLPRGAATPPKVASSVPHSLLALFAGWAQEAAPREATVEEWRKHVEAFVAFIGHDDAARLQRKDVAAWKDHLLGEGNAPKTINGSKLAAVKAALKRGVNSGLLESNAAAGVSVARAPKPGERMGDFTPEEAAAILRASQLSVSPVYRWVPLLCATSGARVAEICQLRVEDIGREDGIDFIHIRASAGSVKNVHSERKVPLHPYVVKQGFLLFVRSRKRGPLFFNQSRRSPTAKKPPQKIVSKNIARWVHTLGLDVGRDQRKDPSHAWRHCFATLRFKTESDEAVVAAIMGHAPKTTGRAYGHIPLAAKAAVIQRLPVPGLWEPDKGPSAPAAASYRPALRAPSAASLAALSGRPRAHLRRQAPSPQTGPVRGRERGR